MSADGSQIRRRDAFPAWPGPDFGRAFAALAVRRRAALAALAVFALLLFLPGVFHTPVVDRDEARFVQTSRQMLETGDLVDLRLHDEPRYKKPAGIYWLHAAAATITGTGAEAPVWVDRLVSVAGATAAVLMTYALAAGLVGAEAALLAAMLLAASVIVGVEARLAKTDAVLLACITASQLALMRIHRKAAAPETGGREPFLGWPLLFWAAMGFGILVKGPVAPMVSGLTALALVGVERRWRWLLRLRPLPGLLVLAALVLPWVVAIEIVSEGRFLREALGRDMLAKLAEGQESHGAPPGIHFLVFWIVFWPGAALFAAAAPGIWRDRADPDVRFLLAWIVPSFLVFELAATKLPHYTMPVFPAIALLVGRALVAGELSGRSWGRLIVILAGIGGALAVVAAPVALAILEHDWSVAAILLVLATLGAAGLAVRAGARGRFREATGWLLAEAVCLYATAFGAVAPRLDTVWLAPRAAQAALAAAPCEDPQVLSAGYTEASLVFAVGTDIAFGDGAAAARFLQPGGCRVALVSDANLEEFVAAARGLGYRPEIAGTVEGINIGNSKWLTIQIAVRGPGG